MCVASNKGFFGARDNGPVARSGSVTNRGNWSLSLVQVAESDGLMARMLGNSNNYIGLCLSTVEI